jgi:hypothetical protein
MIWDIIQKVIEGLILIGALLMLWKGLKDDPRR